MTQPRHRKSPEHRPPSTPYGQQTQYGPQYGQPQYGQPQYVEQPVFRQPAYGPPPFYGPGPYPPPPPKRSNRNLIIAIIGVLVVAGGAVAAAFLLFGNNGDNADSAHSAPNAGPGGGSAMNGTPVPGRSTAFPRTHAPQRQSVAMLSCAGIEQVLIRTGAFKAGSITVSDGGTPPDSGVPVPEGAPTTRCTVSPIHRSRSGGSSHVTAIAWRGVTERTFAAQLKGAGYESTSRGGYTFWVTGGSEVVTATIAKQLVTFYLA